MTTEFIGRSHDFDFLVGGTWHVETSVGSGTRIEAALPSKPRVLLETGETERAAA